MAVQLTKREFDDDVVLLKRRVLTTELCHEDNN